ncbi:hypothetical protein BR93DRAFT_277898 [Coniochaeta sp. PMI_546]|nr:hypothetical protein BR93DRAFT_277898 [Coniochaeta sp. PMI_546]
MRCPNQACRGFLQGFEVSVKFQSQSPVQLVPTLGDAVCCCRDEGACRYSNQFMTTKYTQDLYYYFESWSMVTAVVFLFVGAVTSLDEGSNEKSSVSYTETVVITTMWHSVGYYRLLGIDVQDRHASHIRQSRYTMDGCRRHRRSTAAF